MNTLLSRRAGLALLGLGIAVYLMVAGLEWRLGSAYHAALALGLAVLLGFMGRGDRMPLGTALLTAALVAYGIFRALTGVAL